MGDRLQKILSAYGVASRREAEKLIAAGRVKINGIPAVTGQTADPKSDRIEVDGRVLKALPRRAYIMLNKPAGFVTTMRDEKGRKTVRDLVEDVGVSVYPVGRLDIDSQGLLLMTNDGAVANRLMHPSFGVEKVYRVWASGRDVKAAVGIMSGRMVIDGDTFQPAKIKIVKWEDEAGIIEVAIREGRNRQVRKMCTATDLAVRRLIRISEGELRLGDLGRGQWRYLTEKEIHYLKSI